MTLWEVLAKLKSEIPNDFRPWRVDPKFDNITMRGHISISQTYYKPGDLGWIDEPMTCYREYGIYSSREKAIEAAKEYEPSYEIRIYD